MKLRLQTDYALRVLIYLARAGTTDGAETLVRVDSMAEAYDISREHLVKVVQALSRHGYTATRSGRGGGVRLAMAPEDIDAAAVVGDFEGRNGVLECVVEPTVCVLEPGCRLRRKLMAAEAAFYAVLEGTTLADLVAKPSASSGLAQLPTLS